ncbi:unnamed protein product [Staurois parvus]|uniref:Uncharacterized protein n=1 Tax=Staurois parvus TaxID=386267 RepID=A0ABN9CW96_9NEOB|nr:unnamed protein product [Staurois parvus]
MQMSAVDLRITAHFTHLGSHGAKTPTVWRWRHSNGRHTAPYDKMEPTSSGRRPESEDNSHGRVWHGDQQQWEWPYRDPYTLWTWQQHEEAVQGP